MNNNKVSSKILRYVANYKLDLLIVFIALFTVSGTILTIGNVFRDLVDNGLGQGLIGALNNSIYILVLLVSIFAIGSFFRSYYINNISEKITNHIRRDIYNSILHVDLVSFEELKIGDIVSRLGHDAAAIGDLITNFLSFLVRNFVMLVGGITLMFLQSPKLASLVIFSVPVLLFPLLFLSKAVRRLSREVLETQGNLAANIEESVSGIREVNAYNQQEFFTELFNQKVDGYLKLSSKRLKMRSIFFAMAISCIALAIISVIWVGSIDIIAGKMTSGQMISFIYFSIIVGMSAGGIAEIFSELQGPMAAAERVFELEQMGLSHAQGSAAEDSKISNNFIALQDLSFSYPARSDIKALDKLSLTISETGFYGIVGRSGSGKSTIMQLLLQFYKYQQGSILLKDDKGKELELSKLSPTSLRSIVSYVSQDPFIFSGTIKSNICFSQPSSTDAEIAEIVKLTRLEEFINSLPSGLDTEIGEKGIRLSGGQKQRIALARSLLHKPEILLLDEATSALDSENEQAIMANIRSYLPGKTIISIAHRLSTIMSAKEIFVINSGELSDSGTHDQLVKDSEIYASLYQEQKSNPS